MILAFDTYYYNNKAKTVGVSFSNWLDDTVLDIKEEVIKDVPDYEPGAFYKRELPCILSLLKQYNLQDVELIIVDSYVLLDDEGKLGLGGHLYNNLDKKIPIIGVAKSSFHLNKTNSKLLLRGDSIKPLYISAIGINLDEAYELVKSMHGNYRMPTLLQILDTKTKEK
ncbi:endonuclease V [Cellulophaga sp. RHA19]|uniref:endonuclease V n=1 Tax=Cellulophaga sp. RHA19 TaxID=1798237 RepID=UPI000C2C7F90|nr:endonuclease V [Cellulophaga sp. RHA19]PKB45221.1 endonuclease V [Cellulophaga sp. RHA19]